MRDLGISSLKWDTSSPFPQGSGDLAEVVSIIRSARAGGDEGHQGNKAFYTKRIQAHMNSQRLRQNALSLHRSAPDEVLELKGEVGTCPILYPEISSK